LKDVLKSCSLSQNASHIGCLKVYLPLCRDHMTCLTVCSVFAVKRGRWNCKHN